MRYKNVGTIDHYIHCSSQTSALYKFILFKFKKKSFLCDIRILVFLPRLKCTPVLSILGKLSTQFGMMGLSINCYK